MNYLVGALMLMFLLYIAVKGTLPNYLALLIVTPRKAAVAEAPAEPKSLGAQVPGFVPQGLLGAPGGATKNPSGSPTFDPFGFFK